MKTLIQSAITLFIFTAFVSSCKPETAKDDPLGTGEGKIKNMEISQDSAAATKSVTFATKEEK